jgi:hypothetical protein
VSDGINRRIVMESHYQLAIIFLALLPVFRSLIVELLLAVIRKRDERRRIVNGLQKAIDDIRSRQAKA